ncbi:MAG: hypothetical protein EO766_06320 [Hydrotalea sp. AMD]|uniref:hypothetical protein n=1 Tax=Hydrotalea sp. AMD TaxID=2501297 RepID=UPI0010275B91|nr:hypothetical protein [Hydrotalea sp. AMD]RWZ88764.1 MAG: hypothetical protein EO766_06320 [Hydrotalea sp. AMD]
MPNIKSPNYAQLQQQFFNTNTTADIAIKKLAADIRRQDSMFHFLPAFVRKNGIPRWDKVIYSSNHSNSGNQLSTYGVNATGNTVKYTQSNKTEGSQGIFFIPLQAQNTNTIQSYIVAYKHNDSLYTYRLYNRDSLNAIRPKTSIAKNNLLNTQAVFGYFEQTVNNRDGITIESPVSGKIKNVEIAFHATRNNSANSTQSLNGTMVGGGCEMSIEVTISYSLEVTLDGNTIYITESYSVTLTIIIDCTGGGSCNCTTPKDNIIDGVGGTGNTNGNWWDYGTGYPYFPWNPGGGIIGGGPTEPDWSWWWTGGGASNYDFKTVFDNYSGDEDNNTQGDYDNTPYIEYDPNSQSWPTISNVIPVSEFVGWGTPGIRRNCMDYAKAQISKMGYKISNYSDPGQTIQIYTAANGVNISAAKNGVGYLLSALQRGIPVIVGVDDKPGSSNPNTDNTTDHFVVIIGAGSDSKGKYFTFFDNASGNPNQGANPENKLYYNELTGLIKGKSQTDYASGLNDYIVTMIRKSK